MGALLSMVLGIVSWIIFEFYEISWPSLIPATLISTGAMIAGSLVWPKKQKNNDQNRDQTIE